MSRRVFSSERPVVYESVDGKFDKNLKDVVSEESGDPAKRAFVYFVLGGSRFLLTSIARVMVIKFVASMAASADVLALASIEVDLTKVEPGTTATIKWRGKPVFVRHRTDAEISAAVADDSASLKDPQKDVDRAKNPKYLVVIGVCTHLGCVPVSNAGNWGGWFCPCHGSHYDLSGRIRQGPAPLNLEVPEYRYLTDNKIKIG